MRIILFVGTYACTIGRAFSTAVRGCGDALFFDMINCGEGVFMYGKSGMQIANICVNLNEKAVKFS